jgi:antitoxin HicB
MYEYPLEIHDEHPGVWLSSPDIPEMHAAGDTLEEALATAVDAMETALSIYVDERRPIPSPQPRRLGEHHLLRLPALTVAKVALWNAIIVEGVSKSELARRLDVSRVQVDRMIDFLHHSKIEHVERALQELGRRISITVEAA